MIILVGFRMDYDREINPRLVHLLKQNLGRGDCIGLVGAILVIGEFFVFIACKTMDMSVYDWIFI